LKRILIIHSGQTGRTEALAQAAAAGVADVGEDLRVTVLAAAQAGIEHLLEADGLILATPENFGYMSGALKDFLDRTYYPAEGRSLGLPYAVLVSAGNDGLGAARAIERIAIGYGWKPIAEALIVRGAVDNDALQACRALGGGLAAGLANGIF